MLTIDPEAMVRFLTFVSVLVSLSGGFALAQSCPGDCNEDSVVNISEIIRVVALSLRTTSAACDAADENKDGHVSVAEVIKAVNAASWGCFVTPPTRTPTPRFTTTPTSTPTQPVPTRTPKPTRTKTNTRTRTPTPTRRPTPPFGCPTDLTDTESEVVCVFEGSYNDSCGPRTYRLSLGFVNSRLHLVQHPSPTLFFRVQPTSEHSAQLVDFDTFCPFRRPFEFEGEVLVSEDGRSVRIDFEPFLTAGRCEFDIYRGEFIGVEPSRFDQIPGFAVTGCFQLG